MISFHGFDTSLDQLWRINNLNINSVEVNVFVFRMSDSESYIGTVKLIGLVNSIIQIKFIRRCSRPGFECVRCDRKSKINTLVGRIRHLGQSYSQLMHVLANASATSVPFITTLVTECDPIDSRASRRESRPGIHLRTATWFTSLAHSKEALTPKWRW